MATLFHNISNELTKELLAPGDNVNLSKLSMVNTSSYLVVSVDLYIEKQSTGKFYFLKGVKLSVGSTLNYNLPDFSNRPGQYGLYMKLNASSTETPSVDVILY